MANYTDEQWNANKVAIMEKCFTGFTELGLHGTNSCAKGSTWAFCYEI